VSLHLLSFGALLLPSSSDSLPLSVELNSTLSVEVGGTPHRGLVSSEGEHRERDGDGQVNAELTSLTLVLEHAGGVTILGEDSGTVTPWVGVHNIDSMLGIIGSNNAHNRSENLFIIAVHTGLAVVDDSRTNPVAVRVSFDMGFSSIKKQVSILLTISDESLNASQGFTVVERGDIRVEVAGSNSQSLGLFDDLRDPLGGVTNQNNNRDSHASLTGGTEASTNKSVDGILFLGIGHNDGVVLGTHVDLASLAVGAGSFVNVLTSLVTTNEGDGLDVRMSANVGDSRSTTLHNVNDTLRNT